MRFHEAYVRGGRFGPIDDQDLAALAEVLAEARSEILLTGRGIRSAPGIPPVGVAPDLGELPSASSGPEPVEGGRAASRRCTAAAALARRNVRSLLSLRHQPVDSRIEALRIALTAPPHEAEDALEDAGLVFNLRYSLFATPEATLELVGRDLVITDGSRPTKVLTRKTLREQGAAYFSPEALARLVTLDINHVRLDLAAIQPLPFQIAPGGLMPPDTAQAHLHKGDWRSTHQAVFAKPYCITCGRCFVYCPEDAILHAMFDPKQMDTTGVLGIDAERCTACGICATVCPPDPNGYRAIVMLAAEAVSRPEDHHVA